MIADELTAAAPDDFCPCCWEALTAQWSGVSCPTCGYRFCF